MANIYHYIPREIQLYNYTDFCGIVLLARVDIDYKFVYSDVGCQI